MSGPLILRAFLIAGLFLHKLIWEILKRRDGADRDRAPESVGLAKRIVKLGKIGLLLFIILQTLFFNVFPIAGNPVALSVVGVVAYSIGLATAIVGRLQLGKNWANVEDYKVTAGQSLVTTGIYGHIRHPIYAGDMLMLLGLELALRSWLVLLVPVLFLIILRQARIEEALIARAFPEYDAYKQRTRMFVPYVI